MFNIVGYWNQGKIWRITSGVFPSNTYFCEFGNARKGVLIDPGLSGEEIDAALTVNNQHPLAVVCTHGHFDHAGSASFFQQKYGINVYVPEKDEKLLKASNFLLAAFKIPSKIILPNQVTFIKSGSEIEISEFKLKFRATPGHTPGSCIIQLESSWFTGDTIYAKGVGLSKLPGENENQLRSSILGLWEELTEDITIYPGHGNSASGIEVRSKNKALLQFLQLGEAGKRKLN